MMLGWEQELKRHFREYLTILAAHDLGNMALCGGCHIIQTAVRFRLSDVAEELLAIWVSMNIKGNSPTAILASLRSGTWKNHPWMIANLMKKLAQEKGLTISQKLEVHLYAARSLFKIVTFEEKGRTNRDNTEDLNMMWARKVVTHKQACKQLKFHFTEAIKKSSLIQTPTEHEQLLTTQLDNLKKELKKADLEA